MPRPTTKAALQSAATTEFDRLWSAVEAVPQRIRTDWQTAIPIEDQSRNVRDVLAHLHAWHLLMLRWYAEGMAGDTPAVPAPGYSWRDTPALNAAIWKDYELTSYAEAERLVRQSHADVTALIDRHTDTELFTKKHYPWTGSTSLGAYLVSATSSHYDWGRRTVNALRKRAAQPGR